MTRPFYGQQTVAMPLHRNIPEQPERYAWLAKCPYCGAACWSMPTAEEKFARLLEYTATTFTFACTACALRRAVDQRLMDGMRWDNENAEVAAFAASASGAQSSGG